jgi:hypothetical protein
MRRSARLLIASAAAALAACEPPDERYREPWSVLPPVAVGGRVAFVEQSTATAYFVDPAEPAPRPRLVAVGKKPVLAARRNVTDRDELVVLCQGERGRPGVPPEPASVWIVPAGGGEARRAPLGARPSQLAQDPQGRYAVAHFGRETGAEDVVFNPNEIALVDLGAAGAAPEVTPRTIRSFGASPLGVVFSPELRLPEGPRRLAVILSVGYVTLVDLVNPRRAEITVPLALPEDRRVLTPVQVVFETTDAEPTIFVRSNGSNDITALRLVPATERPDNGNDWKPVLSQLAAGQAPADMAVFSAGPGPGEGPRLLVVSPQSSDVHVIDVRTSRATQIPLEAPASRIQLFEGPSPAEPTKSRPRALLVGSNTGARVVAFLDLERVDVQRTRNLDTYTMGAPATGLQPVAGRGAVVLRHQPMPQAPGLSVVDLHRRTVSPLASAAFADVVEAPAPAERLWILPAGAAQRGEVRIGHVSLGSLSVDSVRVDAPVRAIVPLAGGADGRARVVLVHPHPGGHITILDGLEPRRETARQAIGFLLEDLLERGGT